MMDKKAILGAKKVINQAIKIKEKERVLVVYDEKMKRIANVFKEALKNHEKKFFLEMPQTGGHGKEPDSIVSSALQECDVFLLLTTYSMTHTLARKTACENGARGISAPGLSLKMLSGSVNINYEELKKSCEKFLKILKGKEILIQTPSGTNLKINISDREFLKDDGDLSEKGKYGNIPAGEVFTAPVEEYTDGILAIDDWRKLKGGKVWIKNGKIIRSEGKTGKILERTLKDAAGKNGLRIAEFGLGLNKKAKICGNILEDEKVYGTCHIAFGNNLFHPKGNNSAKIHEDIVLLKPTISIDGKTILENGSYKIF
ncbi:MAG: aminopeptidase [archaeon]